MRISDWSSDVCSSDLDPVHAGTLNVEAPIRVRVTAAGADTAIADIARLMGEAAQGKSRYVRIADRAARYYADRKSVVEGKSVSVRVDIGGRRIIKKKQQT